LGVVLWDGWMDGWMDIWMKRSFKEISHLFFLIYILTLYHISVLGTLTNAYNAGWDVVMINDCCATTTDQGKEASFTISSSRILQSE